MYNVAKSLPNCEVPRNRKLQNSEVVSVKHESTKKTNSLTN